MPTPVLIVPGFIGAVFVLVGSTILYRAITSVSRARSWTPIQGEVVSLAQERRTSSSSHDDHHHTDVRYVMIAHYTYRDPRTGQQVDDRTEVPDRFVGGPGSPIGLVYDPKDPTRSQLAEVSAGASAFVGVVGLFFAAVGVVIVVAVIAAVTGHGPMADFFGTDDGGGGDFPGRFDRSP
ncbi:DUF3592 domain-containing protein [Nocardioides acrostichi]|uniref:DUF3592 domain-containing protein n=1 Tax=Nocardioides acrostichi TaxID=2784339 RepID=A0A930V041_9ACTN|nr:DUF3592 domain-containing protein [Nocardioides acrostichi]MBF4161416.1 DUF3592 domain-containing protein [Nocardioides acrostichi]